MSELAQDGTRYVLGRALISCMLHNPPKVIPLVEEFNIGRDDFDSDLMWDAFVAAYRVARIEGYAWKDVPLRIHRMLWELKDFVPSYANARYYIEQIYEIRPEDTKRSEQLRLCGPCLEELGRN